jgi:hypothetical protein
MYDKQSSANEVNADLWRDNRRRYRISSALLAVAILAAFISPKLPRSGIFSKILFAIFMGSYAAGMIGARWASAEHSFLSKPDRPEPPQLWKFRE